MTPSGSPGRVTVLSLVFWAWLLGPLGAFLAVPLTLLVKAMMVDADPEAHWLRPLISSPDELTHRRERRAARRRTARTCGPRPDAADDPALTAHRGADAAGGATGGDVGAATVSTTGGPGCGGITTGSLPAAEPARAWRDEPSPPRHRHRGGRAAR